VDELSTLELKRVARALETQIHRDYAPVWGVEATVHVFQAVGDVPPDCCSVLIRDETGTQGYRSIHTTKDGVPYAVVQYSDSWSLSVSHECLEMLTAPNGDRVVEGRSPEDGHPAQFLVQICDPCLSRQAGYEIDGVLVSDFVTPAFYGTPGESDRFPSLDFKEAIERPLQVLPGGYLTWLDEKRNHWRQLLYFGDQPEFRDLGAAVEEEESEEASTESESAAVDETLLPAPLGRAGGLAGAINDQVAPTDHLGFRDYVSAFVTLITSPHLTPPITIGIFGSWGVGKSFLLQHIRDELCARSGTSTAADGGQPNVHVVELNAWAYSASEAVWPALVRRVMTCGEREIKWPFPGRFWRKLWGNLTWELRQERGKIVGALLVGSVLFTVALWRLHFKASLVAAAAAALGAAGLIKVVADTLANPLGRWITTVLESGDYGGDIDYMRRMHHDLEVLSERLKTEHGRIVVLIDDLDRCEPGKMVEVLQAINLLLNFESFVVCLGIDARLVTRAIERHYEGLLEQAHASGYEYLDKIVQIPFRIPHPSDHEVKAFLTAQLRDARAGTNGTTGGDGDLGTRDGSIAPETVGAPAGATAPVAAQVPEAPRITEDESESDVAFTDDEIAAFDELARFLEPNPRHLKRIVNVYRLVRSLATIRRERFVLDDPAGTIRLLAIAAQWPYTLGAMFECLDDFVEAEEGGAAWPQGDPLECLYADVKPTLDRERQAQLDRELDDLDRLLAEATGRLTWKALASLSRYIVNFNPAVEEELRAARAASIAAGTPAPTG
jgi:Cdc6-like AAA superfamily ATPase